MTSLKYKNRKNLLTAICMTGALFSIVFISVVYANQFNGMKPTTYHASCIGDTFNGEVTKRNGKFYLESGQNVWLPLEKCVLVEM